MLKSLENLRLGASLALSGKVKLPEQELLNMADAIQAEVDKKYIKRDQGVAISGFVQNFAEHGCSADEIERLGSILAEYGTLDSYIDRFYLPRPLFEDGEPAAPGMDVRYYEDESRTIEAIEYFSDRAVVKCSRGYDVTIYDGDRLKRPLEADTQEKINADVKQILHKPMDESDYVAEMMRLLARQRKLDGVE